MTCMGAAHPAQVGTFFSCMQPLFSSLVPHLACHMVLEGIGAWPPLVGDMCAWHQLSGLPSDGAAWLPTDKTGEGGCLTFNS